MQVAVDVVNGTDREVELGPGSTYGDLLRAVDFRVHEATVLVDGRPVPADAPVAASSVRVLRLVAGG